MDSERELLALVRRGDARAFEALAGPLEGMVYGLCLSMLHAPQEAEDAAQEAMLRAYRALPRFMGVSRFSTWLYRIAKNTCLDVLRRQRAAGKSVSLEQLREDGYDAPSGDAPPDERYERREEQRRVAAAIERLPDDMRALLLLRFGENLSYEELSARLHLPPGTVKSRLSRARDKLRQILQNQHE